MSGLTLGPEGPSPGSSGRGASRRAKRASVAVVVQQIFYRYVRGQTDDQRFAGFGERVAYLAREANFPEPHALVHVPGNPSFPSGHAATSFACAATLAWLTPLSPVALYALAALIAFSRVYVGVHYPLDVIGGAVLGLGVATALRLLVEARRRSAR